jgi:hypothetical protein
VIDWRKSPEAIFADIDFVSACKGRGSMLNRYDHLSSRALHDKARRTGLCLLR